MTPTSDREQFPSKELVSRLLQHWRDWESPTDRDSAVNETRMAFDCKAAADEIERLTAERDEWKRGSEVVNARLLAEIKRLQAALTDIAEPKGMDNESENALRRHSIWCGQIIPIGEQHCHEVSRYDDFQDYRWHRECRDEATTLFARGDIEFIPYENERPAPNGTPQRISEAKE